METSPGPLRVVHQGVRAPEHLKESVCLSSPFPLNFQHYVQGTGLCFSIPQTTPSADLDPLQDRWWNGPLFSDFLGCLWTRKGKTHGVFSLALELGHQRMFCSRQKRVTPGRQTWGREL